MALNLISIEYSTTVSGGAGLFWELTELGTRTLIELRSDEKA